MMLYQKPDPLPDQVQEWATGVSEYLADLFPDDEDGDFEFYKKEKRRALNEDSINWRISGSERAVVGLGVTWDGKPIYRDRRRVVLKFQPTAGPGRGPTSANQQAINTYEKIVDRGDADLVSPFLEVADDAKWIAQEYAIPIDPPRSGENPPTDWVRDTPETKLRDEFGELCERRGLSVNTRRGNVGIDDTGSTVLLDIGGHTEYKQPRQQ